MKTPSSRFSAAQVLEHLPARFGMKAGQRLVEQQRARLRKQRAADRDALTLAAGKCRRRAAQHRRKLEQRDDGVEVDVRPSRREPSRRRRDSRARRDAETAGHPGTRSRSRRSATGTSTPIALSNSMRSSSTMRPRSRRQQARDRVQHAGLAGARIAEQRERARVGLERDVELEIGECVTHREIDHRRRRVVSRRSSDSRAARRRRSRVALAAAASATSSATIESRCTPGMPPGTESSS